MPEKPPQNLAEIARKKRHLHLIEKLHGGSALSKQEIAELESFEQGPLAQGVVKTIEEVARVWDVSYKTIQRWKREGMPVTSEGFYDLSQIIIWRKQKDESQKKKREGKDFWQEKVLQIKSEILEHELKRLKGEYISKDEVERGRSARILAVKRSFLALPSRIAPLLAMKEPREIAALLYEAVGEIVDEFAGVRKVKDEKLNAKKG